MGDNMTVDMISSRAKIGRSVTLGAHVRIYDNVEIGDDSVIEDFCVIGHPAGGEYKGKPLKIGARSIIRSHSILYEGSSFGPDLRVGHTSLIREGVQAGLNLQVGSFNDLEGDAIIGDWVRFHSNVHVGRGAVIGDLVWIFPYVVLTNDPIPPSGLKEGVTLEAGSAICTSAVVLPGTKVGRGAFIAAMTRARGNIPGGALVVGGEGQIVGSIKKLRHKETGKQHPWMTHFTDYYPAEAQTAIKELHLAVEADIELLEKEISARKVIS
ncbi:N-acetyltransferase [Delftia sp. PE138]|uniref:N-acetyltransferase n=1 Tax=Delftia sp. PE138 TaxID=1812483 RepID=UPI001BAE7D83|nr:N-acetyltransferase [Delftia sp. PE138]MBS3719200.1 UDP-3-O-(3-hydroxymyristoyl)glucosamine N-acyltransferase [Delftia sp. PE138]